MTRAKTNFIRWAVLIAIVLMIPFMAMQFTTEIQWDWPDFMIFGIILSIIAISYEVIVQKSKVTVYRVAFGVGMLGAILLFWVNAAVGIIGNEGQGANLLYGAVFLVGAIGAIISRFKAKGMSATLLSAALITMLIPAIALLIWPPTEISWSPGILQVFLISGFFALLFFVSGMLFKQASRHEHLAV